MPYIPSSFDIFAVPNWEKVHPDWHKRWISNTPDRRGRHAMDFGGGGYVLYGSQFTKLEELEAAVEKLGLPKAYIDSATLRIVQGDSVLAYISKAEYERRTEERLAAGRQREDDAIDSYLANERRGIKPRVFESEEEYKDVKNHATRESNNRRGYLGSGAARNTR